MWILFQRIQGCSILWRAQVKAHEKENYLFCLECPQLFLSNNLLKNRSRTIYWIPSKIFMMSWACDISWLCNLVASSNIFRHVSQMKAFLLEWAIRWFLTLLPWQKFSWHISHVKDFSPVCVLMSTKLTSSVEFLQTSFTFDRFLPNVSHLMVS